MKDGRMEVSRSSVEKHGTVILEKAEEWVKFLVELARLKAMEIPEPDEEIADGSHEEFLDSLVAELHNKLTEDEWIFHPLEIPLSSSPGIDIARGRYRANAEILRKLNAHLFQHFEIVEFKRE